MSQVHRWLLSLVAMLACASASGAQTTAESNAVPHLQHSGSVTQLYVDGKPFLALGGELGNSSASNPAELPAMFAKLQHMHLNTVMLPVYWNRIEPTEGQYDFGLLQAAIEQARAHHLHLVLLWFGTWKNSMSCYVPGWMKRDTQRFARVRQTSGEPMEIISPQCTAARDADCRAFAALMRWVKQFDADRQTVIMVQVENEIGMIPQPRDHSPDAETAYHQPVPRELLAKLADGSLGASVTSAWTTAGRKESGTWADMFGHTPQGDEIFAAWQFATYTQAVAQAGKAEYPLPMYVNAALMRPGYRPGQYPSGGPLPHLMQLWKAAAPSLDFLSPDIYFPSFIDWATRYTRPHNPLFIPEMAPSARAPANALYAIAQLNAIGCGPFAIEDLAGDKAQRLSELYDLLAGLSDQLLLAQQQGKIIGLSPVLNFDWTFPSATTHATLGGVTFNAEFDALTPAGNSQSTTLPTLGAGRWEAPASAPLGALLILQTDPEEYLLLGSGVTITFTPTDGQGKIGIDDVQEGRYSADGAWIGGRWLDGDQTHQGRHIRFDGNNWSIQRVRLYRYR